jgi:hypothetical protein
MSGIRRAEIPTINGSNLADEHFSGKFRQRDKVHASLQFEAPGNTALRTRDAAASRRGPCVD